jgi:hypothetical protein
MVKIKKPAIARVSKDKKHLSCFAYSNAKWLSQLGKEFESFL